MNHSPHIINQRNFIVICLMLFISATAKAEELTINDFIIKATANDSAFKVILLDNLKNNYLKSKLYPSENLILGILADYNYKLPEKDEDSKSINISLEKLFPRIGLNASAGFYISSDSSGESSAFSATISIPLAKNAFGYTYRMEQEIAGYEQETARHQIIEAYEEHLSYTTGLYYAWYLNYAALNNAENAFKESKKLLANIEDKRRSGIAYRIDVNKIKLQTIDKEETLLTLKRTYDKSLALVKDAAGINSEITPVHPDVSVQLPENPEFNEIYKSSRTGVIMELLTKKTGIAESKAFNSLLPSAEIRASYHAAGSETVLKNPEEEGTIGFYLGFPLLIGQHENADYEAAKIENKQAKFNSTISSDRFIIDLENLYADIKKQQKLLELSKEKLKAAKIILKDEKSHYNQARSSLNDLISAINTHDQAEFAAIDAEVKLNSLLIEWKRVTDTLVEKLPE